VYGEADMKPALELHASQRLTLTPQLQQSIRLLQLCASDLEQEIEEAMSANPFLERDDAAGGPDGAGVRREAPEPAEPGAEEAHCETGPVDGTFDQGHLPDAWSGSTRDADDDVGSLTPARPTLREHLLQQVNAAHLSGRDRALVAVLVEALDEHGYLRQPIEEIRELLPDGLGVEVDELQVALAYLRSLDPTGVGARSLAECLELQLEALPCRERGRDLALAIVREHLNLLAAHDAPRLLRALQCDEAGLREANALIRRLEPRPGAPFARDDVQYVVADVIVKKVDGRWVASTNPAVVPQIRINRLYADALRGNRSGQRAGPLGQQLQEARSLLRNVRRRFETIQRVAQAIVDRQRRFLDYGELAMRPLVLREIAAGLGLHPSTVSRVTSNKYMMTPRGLVEFKRFFGSHVQLDEGAVCSSTAVRALIRELIAAEDSRDPLSDVAVARALGTKGIALARRTVSKYRLAMKIPPVEARRLAAN
jgi:RNA polymerase sigma-54 factor